MFELYLKLVSQVCFGIFLTALMFYLTGAGILFLVHLSIRTHKNIPSSIESISKWKIRNNRPRRAERRSKKTEAKPELRKVAGGSK
jgi:hypothetical protein